ncbi:Uncharacterised protein [Mycobacteroides abscessus subsp. abscessus]|nr:Uncharacterised protein [Mycobacteroides abscessus subsp. abscessus]
MTSNETMESEKTGSCGNPNCTCTNCQCGASCTCGSDK